MAKQIKAVGDTWRPKLDAETPDGRTVVFFCTSNGQRPYRVVMADNDEVPAGAAVEDLSAETLRTLFERSESMNVSPS
jgi:hypothetical protein